MRRVTSTTGKRVGLRDQELEGEVPGRTDDDRTLGPVNVHEGSEGSRGSE